ncbi:hypothetical protein C9374_010880 [Naegleria lovaniensis]|uniref:Uncharacterized protein n=1 Tax=Naegleria lovaniensis TaxID=51637 RepID=A0AA88GAJ3_NAELO|nr:uncharacterized protein C9374_010880 [Naegleria lovaniensis]KAG2374310.1 hypothetical protein C9374_010880 [Naegleria lovaniensis]
MLSSSSFFPSGGDDMGRTMSQSHSLTRPSSFPSEHASTNFYDQQLPPSSYYQLHNSLHRDRSQVYSNSFGEEFNQMSYRSSYPRRIGLNSSTQKHYNPLIHFFKDSSDLKHKILLFVYFIIGLTIMTLFGRNFHHKEWKVFKMVRDFIQQYVMGGVSHSNRQVSNPSNEKHSNLHSKHVSKTLLSKYEEEYYDFYKSYLEKQEKKKKQQDSRILASNIEKYCSQFKKRTEQDE